MGDTPDTGSDKKIDDFDFSLARSVENPAVIRVTREYLLERRDDSVELERTVLNEELPAGTKVSQSDATTLFSGLVLNGVAVEERKTGYYSNYSFVVDRSAAIDYLETQQIARAALKGDRRPRAPDRVTLTATLPPTIDPDSVGELRELSSEVRKLLFDAESVVRIANPYFDPAPPVVEDIAGAANRGVETRILTRETEQPNHDLVTSLNGLYRGVDEENRNRLEVRDLHSVDEHTGLQEYATHAKVTISDSELCYLGSANLTDPSLSDNFELGVVLSGGQVRVAQKIFDAVFESAERVSLPL